MSVTNIDWLRLYREIIAACSENYTYQLNKFCGQIHGYCLKKSGGTYSHKGGLQSLPKQSL
jgi:hypothetical protein